MTSWVCLVVSGLKFIFHWVDHLLILSKSLSRLFAEVWMSCTIQGFALDERPSVKSLLWIKNNKGPSTMEIWGTPALTFFHVENYPLRTTRCFLSFKSSLKNLLKSIPFSKFSKFPDMRFWVSLKMIPSCHTLSNAFEISRKTILTSRPSSKELYVSWVIDNSWLMQESLV